MSMALLAYANSASAQNIRIVDCEGVPVPFATAQCTDALSLTAETADALGVMQFDAAWDGCDSVTVRSLGFEPLTVALPITEGRLTMTPNVLLDAAHVTVRRTQEHSAAPHAMTTLNPADIASASPENGAEVLWSSGHVMVQRSQQGGGSPIIRGFEANRVLLVVDGIRMNNAIFRSGHLQNSVTVDPLALAGVDVITGASSVLFGSDAMGGVVHYRTRRPSFQAGTHSAVHLGWASANNAPTIHAEANVGGAELAYFTSISFRNFGDLRMGSWRPHGDPTWGQVNAIAGRAIVDSLARDTAWQNTDLRVQPRTGYSQTDVVQKVRFGGPERHLELNAQLSISSPINRFDKLNDLTSDGGLRWSEWHYGLQKRQLLALHYRDHQLCIGRLEITAAVQKIDEDRVKRGFGSDIRETQVEDVTVYSLQADIDKMCGAWELSYGAEWTHNLVSSRAGTLDITNGTAGEALTRYPNAGSTMGSLSAYAALQRDINGWAITTGARYSRAWLDAAFEQQQGLALPFDRINYNRGALTGSASVERAVGRHLKLYANAATAYRNPNVDDVGKLRAKNGYVVVPTADIRPETLYSLESGFALRGFHIGAFQTWLVDAIVPVNGSLNGSDSLYVEGEMHRVQFNANAEQAQINGLVLDYRHHFDAGWRIETALNFTSGRVLQPEEIPLGHIPPTFGRFALTKTYGSGLKWGVQARASASKPIEDFAPGSTDNPNEALADGSPAWWTASATLETPVKGGFTLSAGLHNITDRHYKVFASALSGAGRELRFSLRWAPPRIQQPTP
jgi:hemoglobin/transferrin/lactoferrin receptor protein